MAVLPRRGHITGRQRAVLAAAGLVAVMTSSAMFFSLTALTGSGADYDCGPAAFALVAGPDQQTADEADCGRAAAQRLTTVGGLAALAVVAGLAGSWLLDVPTQPSVHQALGPEGDGLPTTVAKQARRMRGEPPYAGGRA